MRADADGSWDRPTSASRHSSNACSDGHVHSEVGNSLDEPAQPPACYPIAELSEIDVVVALARRALEKTATTDTAQHPYGAVLTLCSASVPVFVSSQRQTGPVLEGI